MQSSQECIFRFHLGMALSLSLSKIQHLSRSDHVKYLCESRNAGFTQSLAMMMPGRNMECTLGLVVEPASSLAFHLPRRTFQGERGSKKGNNQGDTKKKKNTMGTLPGRSKAGKQCFVAKGPHELHVG